MSFTTTQNIEGGQPLPQCQLGCFLNLSFLLITLIEVESREYGWIFTIPLLLSIVVLLTCQITVIMYFSFIIGNLQRSVAPIVFSNKPWQFTTDLSFGRTSATWLMMVMIMMVYTNPVGLISNCALPICLLSLDDLSTCHNQWCSLAIIYYLSPFHVP